MFFKNSKSKPQQPDLDDRIETARDRIIELIDENRIPDRIAANMLESLAGQYRRAFLATAPLGVRID